MGEHSRYNVSKEEGDKILKNKLEIYDQKTLDDTETLLLSDTYEEFLKLLKTDRLQFDIKLIFQIHKYFLGTLYTWAGKIRNVEISKDDILFCASSQIKKELRKLEQIIKKNSPAIQDKPAKVSHKLTIIHCEFNAIHPFREGNGRTIRLFLDLIAAKYGFNLVDYSKSSKKEYIKACIAGMKQDYSKMQNIIHKGLF